MGRTHHLNRVSAVQPMTWVRATGVILAITGVLGALLSNTAAWLWPIVLGAFVFNCIPGALTALSHTWAVAFHRSRAERFNHPRLIGLARV